MPGRDYHSLLAPIITENFQLDAGSGRRCCRHTNVLQIAGNLLGIQYGAYDLKIGTAAGTLGNIHREYPPQKSGPTAGTHLDFIRLTGTRGSAHGNLAFALAKAKDNLIAPLEIRRKNASR